MLSSRKAAIMTGLTIFIAAVLLYGLVTLLKGPLAGKGVYHLRMLPNDAIGIQKQSRVYMAGVEVGQVKTVELSKNLKATITLEIDTDVVIPKGSVASLQSPGIAGVDKLVAIMPGHGPGRLKEGDILPCSLQIGIMEMGPVIADTMVSAKRLMDTTNKMLTDATMRRQIHETLNNVQRATAGAAALTQQAMVSLQKLTDHVDALARDAQGASRQLPATISEMRIALQKAQTLIDTANKATEGISKLTSDPEVQASIKSTSAQIEILSKQMNDIAKGINNITGDTKFQEDIKGTVAKANDTMASAKETTIKVGKFMDRVLAPPNWKFEPLITLESFALPTNGTVRSDLNMRLPLPKGSFLSLGLYDVTERDLTNIQYGLELTPGLEGRYGLYAGKAGAGLDWNISPTWQFRGDLWNPNNLQLDAKVRYRGGKQWSIWAGMDSIFDKGLPLVGVQINR